MLRKILFLCLVGALPFFTSCDKLKGDQGEIGPQGEVGPKGDPGEPGPAAGAFQVTLDTASTDAEGNLVRGFEVGQENIASVEKGVVLVYAKVSNAWFALPGPVFFTNDASNYSFAYGVQGINLVVQLFQLDEVPKRRKFQAVRLVIIPAFNARLNASVDYKNYEAVREAFNLAP